MMKKIILFAGLLFNLALFAQAPYELPKLKYGYDAFQDKIDKETMQIHYEKHHAGYVTNLNKALEDKKYANLPLEMILLSATNLDNSIRNNAGGHYNHSLFWNILTPEKNTVSSEKLTHAIIENFGSHENMISKLNQAAATRFGSGWAWLIVTPDLKLAITSSANQDNPIMNIDGPRGLPIIGIDVWEHAYYLKYQNKRADYLTSVTDLINWKEVSTLYENALSNPLLKDIEKSSWKELVEFHKTMSLTFHSAEKGNFNPIKSQHAQLNEKATQLKTGNIPSSFNNEIVKNTIDQLIVETTKLSKITAKKKANETTILKQLNIVHDVFHQLQGACDH